MTLSPQTIIREHLITERTTRLKSELNEYVFRVDPRADKHLIKQAVETLFKVKVASVRTMIAPRKRRRLGWNRPAGTTPQWKKAIVRLKKDQVITMFDNV